MALYAGSIITSSDINTLKNRVKAEMARRQYGSGSLAAYSGDFAVTNQTDTSNPGKKILIEHFNQTVGYIDKISPTGITGVKNGKINSIATANTLLRIYEQIDRYAADSGCDGLCTGLCEGTCTDSCMDSCTSTCGSNGCTSCTSCTSTCGSNGCTGCTNTCGQNGCTSCTSTCGSNGCTSCTSTCGRNGCTGSQNSYTYVSRNVYTHDYWIDGVYQGWEPHVTSGYCWKCGETGCIV